MPALDDGMARNVKKGVMNPFTRAPARAGRLEYVLACVVLVALNTFSASVQAQNKTPKSGGTLVIGTEADPSSLDPLRIGSYAERQYANAIFDTLLEVDPSGKIVPHLVTSYEVSPDGKTYTLKLRPGVKFHDGTAFDAEAVVFNLNRVRDPKNACRCLGNVTAVTSVKALDPQTVEIGLSSPYVSFPAILADTPAMMASPAALKANPTAFGNEPVGTGPFKFSSWTKGSRFIAEKNPDYWKQGRPFTDKVEFRGLQNSETREATMRSGALDILVQPTPKFTAAAKRDKKYVVLEPSGFGTLFLALNVKNPQLSDVRVRRALAHATNRDLLLKAIFQNLLKPATTPFGYGFPGLSQVKNYPEFNPAKAKALLKEYGKPVSIQLMGDNTPFTQLTITAVQQMWQSVGVKVELKVFDQARLIQNMLSHDFQSALFRWSGRPDPDLNVYGFFHSTVAARATSANYGQYASPEMDKLLDAGRQETDPAKRIAIYDQVSQLLANDLPYIFLAYVSGPLISTPKVHGIPAVPDSIVRVAEVWKD
jgi:peptide/nickel transport system substrate-binding protein